MILVSIYLFFFFFNDTATTEIYTLSYTTLFRSRDTRSAGDGEHPAAVPPGAAGGRDRGGRHRPGRGDRLDHDARLARVRPDRKSTRLNSSHANISYAVFCLKKKNKINPLCNRID